MRITGFLTVGSGEVHRYLKNALERLSGLTDSIVVGCNASDKATRNYLASIDKIKVYDFKDYEWGKQQHIIKQKLFSKLKKENPDWIVCIDADEVLDKRLTREKLEELTKRDEIAYTFYCVQLWNNEKQMRVDGGWGNFRNVRFYKYIPEISHEFQGSPLHCGLAPVYAYKWTADSEYLFKHYGYMKEKDRKKKNKRYKKYDPNGKYFNKSWYNSISQKPQLKPFNEEEFGKKLKYSPKKPTKNKYMRKKLKKTKEKAYYIQNRHGKIFCVLESKLQDHIKRPGIKLLEGSVDFADKNDVEEIKEDPLICDVCGFKAKSRFGLMSHKRKHKKDD